MTTRGADDRPVPVRARGQVLLRRFSIKPHHLDVYLALLPQEVDGYTRAGFTTHRILLETHAEPKITWVYSHPDVLAGEARVGADPEMSAVLADEAPHVFKNLVVRNVRVERLTHPTPASMAGRIAILRRYSITGSWEEFLAIWRRIVEVRESYGFRCLFAVSDEPHDMFTWAFDFAGDWVDFPAAQRGYYHDPDRVALRGVFDYMADYSIAPAEQLDRCGRRFS